ncbi:MAG TPA: hypothetical protein VEK57_06185 [Thermoanaerobaculia bacterium]|nr:hypothetical protein [Thermoanaerobaculia bacterium]
MNEFLARFGSDITAVVSGFDRLVFRGHLIGLIRPSGMQAFLNRAGVRLLDFKAYVSKTSERIKEAALAPARRQNRPTRYLPSSRTDKEDLVQRMLREHPIAKGLVCAFTTVEPCISFEYHRAADPKERGLKLCERKCLHVYKYFLHPVFGLIGTRLQTWFPFNIQIWLNGREWLSVQLRRNRVAFKRNDNVFTWIEKPEAAQRLMQKQLQTDWTSALTSIRQTIHPLHESIFAAAPLDYYWSVYQSEWATDLLFKDPATLTKIYPALCQHAMLHFRSPDVMRFLGRKEHGNFTGDLVTRFKDRPEGVRVKHWVHGNSLKMYDKAGSVLRVETTIAKTTDFRAFRSAQNDPQGEPSWRPMRKGIADLNRRAEVSQAANDRYLSALSVVEDDTTLASIFDQVSRPTHQNGRRIRAIRIGDPDDIALLEAIARGEFATSGFRNRDLRRLLCGTAATSEQILKQQASRITRLLRLLRAHGLIRKVQRSHRYLLSPKGTLLTAALSAARHATAKQLLAAA